MTYILIYNFSVILKYVFYEFYLYKQIYALF